MNFICNACSVGTDHYGKERMIENRYMHNQCKGGTRCDCQHKIERKTTEK